MVSIIRATGDKIVKKMMSASMELLVLSLGDREWVSKYK